MPKQAKKPSLTIFAAFAEMCKQRRAYIKEVVITVLNVVGAIVGDICLCLQKKREEDSIPVGAPAPYGIHPYYVTCIGMEEIENKTKLAAHDYPLVDRRHAIVSADKEMADAATSLLALSNGKAVEDPSDVITKGMTEQQKKKFFKKEKFITIEQALNELVKLTITLFKCTSTSTPERKIVTQVFGDAAWAKEVRAVVNISDVMNVGNPNIQIHRHGNKLIVTTTAFDYMCNYITQEPAKYTFAQTMFLSGTHTHHKLEKLEVEELEALFKK